MIVEWAHQGGAREAPSNTLRAMAQALDRPGAALELDVHATKDGDVVVIHDATLGRTTDGHGRVRHHTTAAVQRLDASWWWRFGVVDDHDPGVVHRAERLDGAYVPRLSEVLDLRHERQHDARMTIEVKSRRAVPGLLCELSRAERAGDGPVTITSFSSWKLRPVRRQLRKRPIANVELAPGLGYLLGFWVAAQLGIPYVFGSRYARLQIPTRKLALVFASPRFVAAAHRTRVRRAADPKQTHLQVDVWTIDRITEMRALLALDVDGIMTDRPSRLREAVLEEWPAAPPDVQPPANQAAVKQAAVKKAPRA